MDIEFNKLFDKSITLHSILLYLSKRKRIKVDSKTWIKEYEKLVTIIEAVGILTNCDTTDIIETLDEIDTKGV